MTLIDESPTASRARQPPGAPFLLDGHRRELVEQSAIDAAVAAERGYASVGRPTPGDDRERRKLARLNIPKWAYEEDRYFPGLLIPVFGPTGELVTHSWKPRTPVVGKDGKPRKYASARGQASRIDCHPRNRNRVADPNVELWVVEGIKKADSLTSRGACTLAVSGVYNWRSQLGTLGDWEDVPLRGRDVVICFDHDATTNMNVLRAMVRFGRWLKGPKGVRRVTYLIVPGTVNGQTVKGADDYFGAGGSLDELRAAGTTTEPNTDTADGSFSDAYMAETVTADLLEESFRWTKGLDWLAWTGKLWEPVPDAVVIEAVRGYVVTRFEEALNGIRTDRGQGGNQNALDGWRSFLGRGRIEAVVKLARGMLLVKEAQLDADPDLLNTPAGVVDLPSGKALPHDPDLLMTKMTSGSYRPGYTHPDWDRVLQVLPTDVMKWMQVRVGQAITGHTTTDGIMPILRGGGENGKSLLFTDGLLPALGDYASVASQKLLTGSKTEHSTEQADLRGRRLVIFEEVAEGRSIDVTALKRVQDVGQITARRTHENNMTFRASHSIFATTNYTPVITEVDHGTWRRLALVVFPFTFRKPGLALVGPNDRRGDPTLKGRVAGNGSGQHDAAVTWAVAGALRCYQSLQAIEDANSAGEEPSASAMALPKSVELDTYHWRSQSDRVMGFWNECLVAEPGAAVESRDLLDHFNSWLKTNGHTEWSKELFVPRFEGHDRTRAELVTQARTTRRDLLAGLVTRGGGVYLTTPGKQYRVWVGVRYRLAADDMVGHADAA
ncbi:DUF3854 domain-containing protein [Frankia sp. AgB1.9]|uniref:phage/plasmid primase, P4 family n=1 Tax=unclassified Frankia TaxID=2632575 RepID=UPI001932E0B4|nr:MULTISPECIES: phage/plasmid primase, P4 family [unclassified Frankia]MBL7487375.1 DUF3854 domain-containing protein [Frankia sp. AgW1.1]MBL7546383.1 DUF3854 domain-containing protein [Frankia sp. AgB1.9]MBL7618572.1 DUF3854 domain-containing protein [Frankia sp. AgB1.8]